MVFVSYQYLRGGINAYIKKHTFFVFLLYSTLPLNLFLKIRILERIGVFYKIYNYYRYFYLKKIDFNTLKIRFSRGLFIKSIKYTFYKRSTVKIDDLKNQLVKWRKPDLLQNYHSRNGHHTTSCIQKDWHITIHHVFASLPCRAHDHGNITSMPIIFWINAQ